MTTTSLFFERPDAGTRAFLVHITSDEEDEISVAELNELTLSAGLEPVGSIAARRRIPDPRTYIGSGKIEEIMAQVQLVDAELVIVDQDLTPSQERNLEAEFKRRVLGRTGLILDIFAQRARTYEGKLQVELAQLQHVSSRLVRGWTHLDRQRGGSGRGQGASAGLGGAGETQLEADQRLIQARIKQIHQRLDKVRRQRTQNRRSRSRADIPTVSLVGYTNAGKSTLFNQLVDARVYAADQLFATLDPTLRKLELAGYGPAILSDTVGFIRNLPHTLVEAFAATLEQVREADLLLHVVDVCGSDRMDTQDRVNSVLKEIDAAEVPQLLVYNKIDLSGDLPHIDRNDRGQPVRVWISSHNGAGLDLLQQAITERLSDGLVETSLLLRPDEGQLRARLYALGAVCEESNLENGGFELRVRLSAAQLQRIERQHNLSPLT